MGSTRSTFTAWIDREAPRVERAVEYAGMDQTMISLILEVYSTLRDRYDGPPRLCHGDPVASNILVEDGRVVALIDWNGRKGAILLRIWPTGRSGTRIRWRSTHCWLVTRRRQRSGFEPACWPSMWSQPSTYSSSMASKVIRKGFASAGRSWKRHFGCVSGPMEPLEVAGRAAARSSRGTRSR